MSSQCTAQCSCQDKTALETIGMHVLDEYLRTFNSGDAVSWAKTLHYPHVRLAGGKVLVWESSEAYAKDNDLSRLQDAAGWGYSVWDWRKMVQADAEKLHFAVQFTRLTPEHKKIGSYESFYIITKANGRWGTQCRSSYVGIIAENTAF